MNLKILYNLWRIKKSATPSRQFKRELWQELEQNFSTTPKIKFAQIWFRWSMVGVASLLIVASLSTGVYAYNSPEVTENSSLYPVKQAIEKVEEATKITFEAKAQFLVKKIARREAEKQVMEKHGQAVEKLEERIEKVAEQLQKTDEVLEKLEAKRELKNKELRPRVQKVLEKRLEIKKERLEKQPRTTKGAWPEPRTKVELGAGQEQQKENKINKQIKSDKQNKSRDDR